MLDLDLDVVRRVYVGFPDPAVVFRAGPVWNADTFDRWHSAAYQRPPTSPK